MKLFHIWHDIASVFIFHPVVCYNEEQEYEEKKFSIKMIVRVGQTAAFSQHDHGGKKNAN